MAMNAWFERARAVAGAPRVRGLATSPEEWLQAAQALREGGARLLALWGTDHGARGSELTAAYAAAPGVLLLGLLRPVGQRDVPGIDALFPAAARMQRALRDLSGLDANQWDRRPWLRHAAWPAHPPLVGHAPESAPGTAPAPATVDDYPFVRVEGEGVHEIAVGPVHAGIIEPGHFRFSVVGEKVLRLEIRLGYVHKGIEQRFEHLPLMQGHRLAARVSGDSAAAYSWAYCQALEGMAEAPIPARAAHLRALALECERLANHLGDLGALGNDAGFAFGLAQFSRLKENLLRALEQAFAQRYLLDFIVPGGTRADLSAAGCSVLERCVRDTLQQAALLRRIYEDHAGVRDRFTGTGTVTPELAARLGLTGLAGRASGQRFDLRVDAPCYPYAELNVVAAGGRDGDVAARVAVRFDELVESGRLIHSILAQLPSGAHSSAVPMPAGGNFALGLVEGWRGPVLVALLAGEGGAIQRCHPHDPSWQNWPVLEHAVIGNIVPDFPLINKSFNLSYSGHDL